MKIKRITHYAVNVPERRWWWSDDVYGQPPHRRADRGVAEVETDDGITGVTEIGRDTPLDVIEESLNSWLGLDVAALNLTQPYSKLSGALEQAVLDIRGQAIGAPIWQLLGGRLRDRIPMTQCTGYKTPQNTADDAQWGWERGFRTYKMKCITEAETTPEARIAYVVDRIEAIHAVVPDMAVRPDVRGRLEEVWVAQEVARRLQGHKMDCLESPIAWRLSTNYGQWRRLRDTIHLPIADHVNAPDMVAVFKEQAVDYAIVKGKSAYDTVFQSRFAHELGMPGWAQTAAYGPGSALTLHVAACMANLSRPFDMIGPFSWEDMLVNEDFPFEDGCFIVPDRPGLGYTLNHDAVGRYQLAKRTYE